VEAHVTAGSRRLPTAFPPESSDSCRSRRTLVAADERKTCGASRSRGTVGTVTERRLRILVVDDDERLRVLLRTTFELVETVVEEVADAEAAREVIARRAPDVIVLDVGLPGMDGVAFARELKGNPRTAGIGVVLLTGGTLTPKDGEDAGASSVIRKPFSPLDLLAAVERAAGSSGTPLMAEAVRVRRDDQLLLYAGDVRRLLEVERRHRRSLERSYRETLGALAIALESRDADTGQHSLRVQRYALELTRACAPELLDDQSVEFGYLLHDIGKVAIPDAILQKPGPLTIEERQVMEQHTVLGAQILAGVGLLDGNGIGIVRHHHERWDGSGYPDGLARTEIPFAARIFAVADAIDAITSNRPYRRAGSWESALDEVALGAGSQFDPTIVRVFLGCHAEVRRAA
jgi:putative nucleotidyltransferase with HDIG domain